MASKKAVATALAEISLIYPEFAKDQNMIVQKAKIWEDVLSPYSDEQVAYALKSCIREMKFAPKPADFIERLQPSKAELWATLDKTLYKVYDLMDKFTYTAKEDDGRTQGEIAKAEVQKIWDNLSPELKAYIGSKGMMLKMAQYDDKALQYERSAFMKADVSVFRNTKQIETNNRKELKE